MIFSNLNRMFGKFERFISKPKLNLFATLYFNFRTLPFIKAIKLPLFIYGSVKFYELAGKVEILSKIESGMIKFGRHDDIYTLPHKGVIKLSKNSKICFHGRCSVGRNYLWRITNEGVLDIGKLVWLGNRVTIICSNSVKIGDYSSLSFDDLIMDNNCHYSVNLQKNIVYRREGCVFIGKRNWVGNHVRLLKGCDIGDGNLIAAGSMVNHNFLCNYCLLAGAPAKVKYNGITRVFSGEEEREIKQWFDNNPDKGFREVGQNFVDPIDDIIKYFL